MANFLTRLVTRHLGLTPVVQPLIAPMFTSGAVALGSNSLGFEAQTSTIDSFSDKQRSWGVEELGRAEIQADFSSSGTGKMAIPQAELSSFGEVGVLPTQARDAISSSQPHNLMPSPEQSDSFTDTISAISSEATRIQPTPENQGNRVQPLVEWAEEIQPNTFEPLDTNRSQNVQEMRSHLPTSSEQQDSSPLTQPSSSPTPKADTPQNLVANFTATPPTQPPAAPGMIQRHVDASMRSHSSIDSPINPPNLAESSGFVVEDIPLEQPSPVKPTLPLVSPEVIPSVQPTTTNVPSRVEPLFNEVLETGQPREHTQYGSDQTSLTPPYEGRRESSSPRLVGEEQGERLTEPDWDNTEVLERDRSTAQPDSQISNLGQRNAPRETQATQQPIELDLAKHHKSVEESTKRQQNPPTARSSEQTWGGKEGETRRSLQEDSSSKPAPTVPSRTFSQQLETSTGSNPPLRATAQRREFIQLVPQRSLSASQSVPVSGIANGETGDGGKERVGSLTATGDERMSEPSFLPHQNVDDPPKSPFLRGTLSNIVSPLERETLSNIVPPLNRESLSNIIPPFLRGVRGDRVMSSTFETPSESSSAMQVQVQSEKLSSLARRSLSAFSESSSRQSRVHPITNDVPKFPSSNPTHRRNAANFDPTTRLNPVETTPTIQISIGRIEVRASQPPTPPPRTKSTQRGPTQSLQDYLKQRQGGKS